MNLPESISEINNYLSTISDSKTKLAFTLLNTKRDNNWKTSKYGSWKGFCNTTVALSHSSIYIYVKTAELAEKNKFSLGACILIVNTIGWERFRIGLTKIAENEVITPAVFIERYKELNLNERVTYEEDESDLEGFTFNLPQEAADKLSNALLARGMRMTNKSRSNMSAAMVKLINDLITE